MLDSFSADIKREVLVKVENNFENAQLLRKQSHHKEGKKAIRALLDSKELKYTTFMEIFDNYEEGHKVLECNVFAYHPAKHIITFRSQAVESYIQENASIFIE